MTQENILSQISRFDFEGQEYEVEEQNVEPVGGTNGVICAEYKVVGHDKVFDLGLIHVPPGENTPPQLVMSGDRTIEIYKSGSGILRITRSGQSTVEVIRVSEGDEFSEDVNIGDTMQWEAGPDGLRFLEVCYPPFTPERFAVVGEV